MSQVKRYEFGSVVTDLHCETADAKGFNSHIKYYAPASYEFNVNGLRVPVANPNDLPMVGSSVRVTIEWDA